MRAPPLDVYLLPAVIGGGLGDIAEVMDAGRWLERAGFRIRLFRAPGRPLPPSVDGPWDWPAVQVVESLHPRADRALTLTPVWGVSAAPGRREAYGRAGPWAPEAAEIEHAYGPERTVHVSLEEFARTYSSAEENLERYREGGVPAAEARRRAAGERGRRERREWVGAFRLHRALDRPNVLHFMGVFDVSARFAREFPEIRQVGPLWPRTYTRSESRHVVGRRSVLWYASPSSSSALVPSLARGLTGLDPPVDLLLRSPRPVPIPAIPGARVELLSPIPTRLWRPRFRSATLRIVTGSRSLLEALELGAPFLYFNGVLRPRGRPRRHRPEKVAALLRLFARLNVASALRADLRAFASGQRVAEVVRRAVEDRSWRSGFPPLERVQGAVPRGLGETLVAFAREFATTSLPSAELVAQERARPPRGPRNPVSKV